MGQPIATKSSQVTGTDTHIAMVPTPGGPVPVPQPLPFVGVIDGATIPTVKIGGKAAAVVGSTAKNDPPHMPLPPGASFQKPPANKGTVKVGSATVKLGGKAAARSGDSVLTCNDPSDAPVGSIVAVGTVKAG